MKKEFGILAFCLVITFLISTVLGFYYYPAEQKIEKLNKMINDSDAEMDELDAQAVELKRELEALDRPLYIEILLRSKYKWVPKYHVDTIDSIQTN